MVDLKAKIVNVLKDSQRVSICCDIWTKKGMSSSYLGIAAHFFTRSDHVRHRVTLAVRRMPSPHTGENIRQLVDDIFTEWDIPPQKVAAVITDNGSNMLATLILHLEQMKKVTGVAEPATTLLAELKRRFRKFTDPTSFDHDHDCHRFGP